MKSLFALLLLPFFCFSQDFIQLSDGSKITPIPNTIKVNASKNKLYYLMRGEEKEQCVKFKKIDSAAFGGFKFVGKKVEKRKNGYYVMAKSAENSLLMKKATRVKSRGGFETYYNRYEIAVLDKADNVLRILNFTDEATTSEAENRGMIASVVAEHFPDCTSLIERITLYESADSAMHKSVLKIFENPVFVDCK